MTHWGKATHLSVEVLGPNWLCRGSWFGVLRQPCLPPPTRGLLGSVVWGGQLLVEPARGGRRWDGVVTLLAPPSIRSVVVAVAGGEIVGALVPLFDPSFAPLVKLHLVLVILCKERSYRGRHGRVDNGEDPGLRVP